MKTATRLIASLLLLTGWYACDRPTPVAPSESTLTIIANPTRIGVNESAIISVLARKADGTAVNPGTEINFATDLGTIDPVVTTDPRGIAEATLTGDGRIGMAMVSADSGAAATATLEVQIGALPNTLALSTTKGSINKNLPGTGARIRLKAEVYDDLSNPIEGISVIFEAPTGTFENGGSVVTNVNGVSRNVLIVTDLPDVSEGFFEITARTRADDGSELLETIEILVTGFALNITLSTDPSSIPVTGGVVRLTALVRDAEGALEGEGVNFTKDAGSLASRGGLVNTDAGGQAFDTLTITAADLAGLPPGSTGISVGAQVSGNGGILIDAEPRAIQLQSDIPIAGFDFAVSGLTANFTNTTTGDVPLTYMWDFGDGGTSTSDNPGNTYAVAGTYSVTLTATNVAGSNTLTKDVTVASEPDISLSPASLSFGSVKNPGTADRIFTVSNAGLADLTITSFSLSNPSYSVISAIPPPLSPGAAVNITVRFTPPVVTASTSQAGTLTVISNDPDEPTASVALSGTALP